MKILATILSLVSLNAFASMLPPNDLRIPVDFKGGGIGESIYHEVIDKISDLYRPIIEAEGYQFQVEKLWDDERVNAAIGKKRDIYRFRIYGGLARFSPMLKDPFTLVLCHEMGHILGGAPTWKPRNQISSEGQADYYSTLKCFRKYVATEDNEAYLEGRAIHPLALDKCGKSFETDEQYNICLRSSLAIQELSYVLAELRDADVPKLETPDKYIRRVILFNGYPNIQCRVDTLFAGAICPVNDGKDFLDRKLYNDSVCSIVNGDQDGVRPRCWYVPRANEENE